MDTGEGRGAHAGECGRLLREDGVRFAGVIDGAGRLVSGGFREGVTPLEGDESRLRSFMESVSRVSAGSDYDESLGPIRYLAARRDRAVVASFPLPAGLVLLVSAEPEADIEELAGRVEGALSGAGQEPAL